MSFETDFDTAFTILLGKAAGLLTPTGVVEPPDTGGGTVIPVPVTASIEFVIDGGGSTITNGVAGGLLVPFDCSITKVVLQEFDGTSGSITVDVRHGTPGSSPSFSSITGSNTPRITSGRNYTDSTLTGWSTTLSRDDSLQFVVSGIASFTRITIALYVRRTDITGVVA